MILEDKFLKKIEEIKENISKINDPLEMVRFLDEIQINTAHHGLRIITGKYLCMYKSGPELVDLHSCIHQFQIIRVCQKECVFLL